MTISTVNSGDLITASKMNEVINGVNNSLPLSGGTMTGAIAMGNKKITGLATPTNNADAATKQYVDTHASSVTHTELTNYTLFQDSSIYIAWSTVKVPTNSLIIASVDFLITRWDTIYLYLMYGSSNSGYQDGGLVGGQYAFGSDSSISGQLLVSHQLSGVMDKSLGNEFYIGLEIQKSSVSSIDSLRFNVISF